MLPTVNMPTFIKRVPFNWKNREIKNKLKTMRVTVDCRLTKKRKEARRHRMIASTKSPMAKPLMVFTYSLSFLLQLALVNRG